MITSWIIYTDLPKLYSKDWDVIPSELSMRAFSACKWHEIPLRAKKAIWLAKSAFMKVYWHKSKRYNGKHCQPNKDIKERRKRSSWKRSKQSWSCSRVLREHRPASCLKNDGNPLRHNHLTRAVKRLHQDQERLRKIWIPLQLHFQPQASCQHFLIRSTTVY